MSKKDKSKFRKRIKAQILQEMTQFQQDEKRPSDPVFQKNIEQKGITAPTPANFVPTAQKQKIVITSGITTTADTLQLVRHDLKKSAIIIGSLLIIIIALFLIDQKIGILLKIGDQIFSWLNISA